MAIEQGTETIEVSSQERTWRVNIETAFGTVPVVTIWRERIRTGPDHALISQDQAGTVSRGLSAVADQSYTVAGKTMTTAEIAGFIAAVADVWRAEDTAAEAARQAAYAASQAIDASGGTEQVPAE